MALVRKFFCSFTFARLSFEKSKSSVTTITSNRDFIPFFTCVHLLLPLARNVSSGSLDSALLLCPIGTWAEQF